VTVVEAARMGLGAVVVLAAAAGVFWLTVTVMGVVFPASPAQPLPVVMPASSSHAPPKGRPSPSQTHRRVVVAPASLSPVSAVPIRTRQPSPAVAPSPSRTTLRPSVSVTATQPPAPAPTTPPTASPAPSTAITAPPPSTPGGLSGSGP
jgi:hypothetical protein